MIPEKILKIGQFDFDQPGYAEWPIPSDVDQDIMTVVDWYQQADRELRLEFESVLSRRARKLFVIFSQRMASLAARDKSDHYIRYGFIALIIENEKYDVRYSWRAWRLLHNVAFRMGLDTARICLDLSAIATGKAKESCEALAKYNEPAQIIGDFKEIQRPDGVFYSAIW